MAEMDCRVMLVEPSCLVEGWKGIEADPVVVSCWEGAPKGDVVGAPKAGAGVAIIILKQ